MTRLQQAFDVFDAYNKQSPGTIEWEGVQYPIEYFYALKLHDWVVKLEPDASESLLLASRSQHIGRWKIARDTYPEGRVGYLKWRSDLSRFHAKTAADILESVSYDEDTIARVKSIIQKQRLKSDPEVQTIENALCLVFLEYQYDDLIEKHSDEKIVDILQKTWKKMSEPGQQAALKLSYSEKGLALIQKALAG